MAHQNTCSPTLGRVGRECHVTRMNRRTLANAPFSSVGYKLGCAPSCTYRTSILVTMAQQEVILITGANTGLGFQIVRALCQSGRAYSIIVGGRSLDKAEKAIKSVESEFPSSPSKLSVLTIDIEHDNSIKAAFDTVSSIFGKVDALVNNAGTIALHYPNLSGSRLTV